MSSRRVMLSMTMGGSTTRRDGHNMRVDKGLVNRRTAEAEQAMDRLREKFGERAVIRGLAFNADDEEPDDT